MLENVDVFGDKQTLKNLIFVFINYIYISDAQSYMNLSQLWCLQQTKNSEKNLLKLQVKIN